MVRGRLQHDLSGTARLSEIRFAGLIQNYSAARADLGKAYVKTEACVHIQAQALPGSPFAEVHEVLG